MKAKKSGLAVLVVILGIVGLSDSAVGSEVPLPDDINIVAPATDLPPEIRAFSGKWTGKWDGFQDAILIVEQISFNDTLMVYAWSKVPIRQKSTNGYKRFKAKVYVVPKPLIEFEINRVDQPLITFEIQKDLNTIKGFWVWIVGNGRQVMRIVMKRAD